MFNIPALTTTQWLVLGSGLLAFVAISLAAINDAFKREFDTSTEKLAWLQLAILVPFLGGIAYFIFGRKRGRKIS